MRSDRLSTPEAEGFSNKIQVQRVEGMEGSKLARARGFVVSGGGFPFGHQRQYSYVFGTGRRDASQSALVAEPTSSCSSVVDITSAITSFAFRIIHTFAFAFALHKN